MNSALRRRIAVVAAVVAPVALTAGAVLAIGGGRDRGDEAATTTTTAPAVAQQPYLQSVSAAFEPLTDVLPDVAARTRDWSAGEVTDAALRDDVPGWASAADDTRRELERLEPMPEAPAALPAFRRSADLYLAAIEAHALAVDVDGAMRQQVDLLGRRLRVLGDRVFDRGRAAVDAAVPPAPHTGVDLRRAEEVPFWPAEELAAGPPVAAPPPLVAPAERFPRSQEDRPTQPVDEWLAAVAELDLASPDEVSQAVAVGDGSALAALAASLWDDAEVLRAVPDPARRGGREEGARLRLGLLVLADAATAGRAATLVDDPEVATRLRELAEQLVAVAADPVLGADHTA